MEQVVLVGAGGFGSCWWPGLTEHRDRIQVVGVVEPARAARAAAADYFGLPEAAVYAAPPAGLGDFGATAVIDSSPFFHRADHVRQAVAAGLDLLVAKPFGASYAEAAAMVETVRQHARTVAVAQQMRYFPCFTALREMVGTKQFGTPRNVTVRMALDGRGWEPGTEWRLGLRHPLLLEAAIHHVDLMRWVLQEPIEVTGAVEFNPPWSPFRDGAAVRAELRTESQVSIDYQATFAPGPDDPPVRFDSGWTVEFDDAVVVVDDGGVLVGGNEVAPSTDEPVSLAVLNAELLGVWLRARETGAPVPFDGTDNLASMRLLDQLISAVEPAVAA